MSGSLFALVALTCVLAAGLWWLRRHQLERMAATVDERAEAVRTGAAKSELMHPVVDLSRCLGCGTCVVACPEEDVLDLVHGQAVVVNGSHCVGVAACARECPVGAITVTLADLEERRDVPAIEEDLEAVGRPGLYLAGEVTARALIKVAIEHGTAAVRAAAERCETLDESDDHYDVVVVGAGPAGLAAALEAKRLGLSCVTLDQAEELGGTVAKYPRRKLVLTQPVEMPLVGRLPGTEITKETLMEFWADVVAREELAIVPGQVVDGVDEVGDGTWVVRTQDREVRGRNVVLALGRRGVPRKLEVPGEELTKVAYSLIDARSFEHAHLLVVGGGDSAVEAALGLAECGTNEVTLSYRREAFFRIKKKNREKLERAVEAGRVRVMYKSEVEAIREDEVALVTKRGMERTEEVLPNDFVFVMAGGVPPFELLEQAGVSFDPALRPAVAAPEERGTGLVRAVGAGLVLCLLTLVFALWHSDYYLLDPLERPTNPKHVWLRPGRGLGLWLGIAGVAMVLVNLLYVARRSPKVRFAWGSLEAWMTSHVATGILAFLFATLHGAFTPRDTVGGRAFWALGMLLVTGAIGRYFYAWVPRSANGTELALEQVKAKLAALSERWHEGAEGLGNEVRDHVFRLVEERQWKGSFLGRALALVGVRADLWRVQREITAKAREVGLPEADLAETLALAASAHRTALMAAHYEDLRAVLATWRYFHRWVAIGMLLLLVAHVVSAIVYSAFWFQGVDA